MGSQWQFGGKTDIDGTLVADDFSGFISNIITCSVCLKLYWTLWGEVGILSLLDQMIAVLLGPVRICRLRINNRNFLSIDFNFTIPNPLENEQYWVGSQHFKPLLMDFEKRWLYYIWKATKISISFFENEKFWAVRSQRLHEIRHRWKHWAILCVYGPVCFYQCSVKKIKEKIIIKQKQKKTDNFFVILNKKIWIVNKFNIIQVISETIDCS